MRKFQIGGVIAERRFEYQAPDGSTHNVEVRLGRPTSDGGGEEDPWVCPFQITALGPAE